MGEEKHTKIMTKGKRAHAMPMDYSWGTWGIPQQKFHQNQSHWIWSLPSPSYTIFVWVLRVHKTKHKPLLATQCVAVWWVFSQQVLLWTPTMNIFFMQCKFVQYCAVVIEMHRHKKMWRWAHRLGEKER
jgi:hypothetical protein